MKKTILFLMISILIIFLLLGCGTDKKGIYVIPEKTKVVIGEPVKIKVRYGTSFDSGQTGTITNIYNDSMWTKPSNGASISNAVFTATKPGIFLISIIAQGLQDTVFPGKIIVKEAPKEVFSNHNKKVVYNNGTSPSFETKKTLNVTSIETYHYNEGKGTSKTGEVSLKSEDGKTYGPFDTKGTPGQGNVPNAYWTASPKIKIPVGTYTVIDSDPSTWSQNAGSKGKGMVKIRTNTK